MVEAFNNVPGILEKARRAVDDVTREARNQGGGGETPKAPEGRKSGGAGPKRPKAAPRKQSAKAGSRPPKPSRPPAAKEPTAAPAASAPDLSARPQLGLADCGITVKHAIPGRIRLRLYQLLHNEPLAAKLPALLAAVPGITSVDASINTGSLLITFSPGELAAAGSKPLAGVMHQFFPGLDTESLIKRMLGG